MRCGSYSKPCFQAGLLTIKFSLQQVIKKWMMGGSWPYKFTAVFTIFMLASSNLFQTPRILQLAKQTFSSLNVVSVTMKNILIDYGNFSLSLSNVEMEYVNCNIFRH